MGDHHYVTAAGEVLSVVCQQVMAASPGKAAMRTKINWRFDCKTARRKFGYKKKHLRRSQS